MSTIREPELPAHSAGRLLRPGREPEKVYTADQLRAYGAQCAQWAMERAAKVCDDVEERPWYGYENPNTFQDGKNACVCAINALMQEMK